jgi:hypothetical protein
VTLGAEARDYPAIQRRLTTTTTKSHTYQQRTLASRVILTILISFFLSGLATFIMLICFFLTSIFVAFRLLPAL